MSRNPRSAFLRQLQDNMTRRRRNNDEVSNEQSDLVAELVEDTVTTTPDGHRVHTFLVDDGRHNHAQDSTVYTMGGMDRYLTNNSATESEPLTFDAVNRLTAYVTNDTWRTWRDRLNSGTDQIRQDEERFRQAMQQMSTYQQQGEAEYQARQSNTVRAAEQISYLVQQGIISREQGQEMLRQWSNPPTYVSDSTAPIVMPTYQWNMVQPQPTDVDWTRFSDIADAYRHMPQDRIVRAESNPASSNDYERFIETMRRVTRNRAAGGDCFSADCPFVAEGHCTARSVSASSLHSPCLIVARMFNAFMQLPNNEVPEVTEAEDDGIIRRINVDDD